MKFIIYKRVKISQQHDDFLELEAQDGVIQAYLDDHVPEDYRVSGGYTDLQAPGDIDTPELHEAIEEARETGAALLVARLDCLSMELPFLKQVLSDTAVDLKVAQMPQANKAQLYNFARKQSNQASISKTNTPQKAAVNIQRHSLAVSFEEDPAQASAGRTGIFALLDTYRSKNKATRLQATEPVAMRNRPKNNILCPRASGLAPKQACTSEMIQHVTHPTPPTSQVTGNHVWGSVGTWWDNAANMGFEKERSV